MGPTWVVAVCIAALLQFSLCSAAEARPQRKISKLSPKERRYKRAVYKRAKQRKYRKSQATGRRGHVNALAGVVNLSAGFGAEIGARITPKFDLALRGLYSDTTVEAEGDALFREYMELSSFEMGGIGRYFFTKSFYLSGGASVAFMNGNYGAKLPDDSAITAPFQSTGLIANFGLGNHWDLGSNWNVGVTWVEGLSLLSHSSSVEAADSGFGSGADPTVFEERLDEALTKSIEINLLVVSAGMSL